MESVEKCKSFIRENFLQMPTVKSVSIYSLFINDYGTFTDTEVIKQALSEVKENELFKR
jgi:hypothetical protein